MFPSRGPHIGDYAQTTLADPPKSRIDALGDPYHFFSVGASREACLLGALKRLVCFGFFGAPKCVAICPCATFLDFQLLCFALICFDLLRFASICFDLAAMHPRFLIGNGRVCTAKKTDQANESRRGRRDLRRHWMHPASWMQPLIR